jgi:hypothetical protein
LTADHALEYKSAAAHYDETNTSGSWLFGATALNKKILALLALAAFGVKQKPPRSET